MSIYYLYKYGMSSEKYSLLQAGDNRFRHTNKYPESTKARLWIKCGRAKVVVLCIWNKTIYITWISNQNKIKNARNDWIKQNQSYCTCLQPLMVQLQVWNAWLRRGFGSSFWFHRVGQTCMVMGQKWCKEICACIHNFKAIQHVFKANKGSAKAIQVRARFRWVRGRRGRGVSDHLCQVVLV